ncbi:glycosyltransferase [Allorhodopirellula solitaria]|uniref:Mannosylfructose-phosphate synthase n=1 Tax=Allorhodopirellula solitaria TaxID=2527987 RepID=A0A5C5XS63_9BACT|nr:glycosyltransferase [Allorhodopirellula solitaria]TWT66086.1 Mannosylfructose-phosphate synthase [Allorhodopirellula solitaria]
MATSMRGGGSERQVALLARHLSRDRFDVHLYLTHRTGELLGELPGDVILHSLSAAPASRLRGALDRVPGTLLRRQAKEFAQIVRREQIDVVYDRAFHNTLIAGHPAIDRLDVRRVSTIVSPPHAALPMVEKRFVELKRRRLATAYRASEHVIAVSQAAADSAAEYYGLRRERVTVIRNPVDVQRVRSVADESSSRSHQRGEGGGNSIDGDSPGVDLPSLDTRLLRLVCVGRMTGEKGQADLLDAISRLPQRWPESLPRISLQMIGDGPDRQRLEQQWLSISDGAGRCGGHAVEFAGVISPAIASIHQADALVLPSRFEGLPNVVLEAFALQTPVVATRSGGTAEMQADASNPTCFWAEPGDPESLAGALIEMVRCPAERAKRVDAATRLIQSRHALGPAVEEISGLLLG